MGYISQVVIAIHKQVLVRNLLTGTQLPEMLQEFPAKVVGIAHYWFWDSIKWYTGYPSVDEVNQYLASLDDEPDIEQEHGLAFNCYGFMRIGEDENDIESRGEPDVYDVHLCRSISTPIPEEEPTA